MPATQPLSPENLNQLLAPIALYPDALIALMLPASTVPSDVVLASRYLADKGDPKQIPNQSWDNSVQSLASYPDVVTWMAQNIEWTTSLGQAFLVQPAEVMNAIQQLRAQAQAAGNLVSTPQQVIVKEKSFIRIVPAEPEYLYVPQYDPEIVYVQPYSQDYGPMITFGVGFAVGSWLNYDFDWNRHQIYRGDWQPGWNYSSYGNGGNNIVNVVNINQNTAQPWQASSRSRQQLIQQQQSFQPASNNYGNTQVPLGVAGAPAINAGQRIRQVPQPSHANFGNRGGGNRNIIAPAQQPVVPLIQPAAGTPNVIQPTTPPNVVGQRGKPIRNLNNANVGQNGNKRSQKLGKNGAQLLPSTVQAPQNSAPGQVGSVPVARTSKNQRGTPLATSGQVPQPSQAPVVDQNGRIQSTASQPTTSAKRNQRANSSLQKQDVPTLNQTQPSSASSGINSARKNNNPSAPIQKSQSAAGNNRPQQKPEQQQQPKQASQPQQQPRQQPKQASQPQQQPRQQPKQASQPQPQAQQQKPQQKAAPAPKQNPARAAQTQSKPDAKKSDKKDEPKP